MRNDPSRLSSNKLAAGIALSALLESFLLFLVLRELGALEQMREPLHILLGGSLFMAAAVLFFGMPLALRRLRDPQHRYRDWAATGALGGLIAAILVNLAMLVSLFTGFEPAEAEFSVGLAVIMVLFGGALIGAAVATPARAIAIGLHNRALRR